MSTSRVALGDVGDFLTGFPFKSADYASNGAGVRLLRGDNIVQGQLRWEGAKRWPDGEGPKDGIFKLEAGDVVLAMDRPWIEAGLKWSAIRPSDLPALLVQRVARLRGTERLDNRYLRYVIASSAFTVSAA